MSKTVKTQKQTKPKPQFALGNDLHLRKIKSAAKASLHSLSEVMAQIETVKVPYNKKKLLEIYNLIVPFYTKYQHMASGELFSPEFCRDLHPIMVLQSQQTAGRKLFLTYSGDPYCGLTRYVYWYFAMPTNIETGTLRLMKSYCDDLKYHFENPPKHKSTQCSISDWSLVPPAMADKAVDSANTSFSALTIDETTFNDQGLDGDSDVDTAVADTTMAVGVDTPVNDSGHGTLNSSNPIISLSYADAAKSTPIPNNTVQPSEDDDGFDTSDTSSTEQRMWDIANRPTTTAVTTKAPKLAVVGRQNAVDEASTTSSDTSWEEIIEDNIPMPTKFTPLNPNNF